MSDNLLLGFGAQILQLSPAMKIPPSPWTLRGQAAVFWVSPLRLRLLVSYDDSPVGAYNEHAVVRWTACGPHVFQMSVNLEASRIGGREIWGFPKTLETLEFRRLGNRAVFQRQNREYFLRIWPLSLPLWLPFWSVQTKGVVPGIIQGKLGLCRRGARWGVWVEEFQMTIFGARGGRCSR